MRNKIYGVGYWDGAETTSSSIEYKIWIDMLRRCYNKEFSKKHGGYADCTVNERWHSLKNFMEDLPTLKNYDKWKEKGGYHLDKDLYGNGKEYSKENCCFLATQFNSRLQSKCRPIVATRLETGEEAVYQSIMECGRFLQISSGNIAKVLKHQRTKAKGYSFEYLEVKQ